MKRKLLALILALVTVLGMLSAMAQATSCEEETLGEIDINWDDTFFEYLCPSVARPGRSSIPELHLCLQRGLQRFFGQFVVVYSYFHSSPFAFRHSLETVSPYTPRLSVAAYVVKKLDTRLFAAYLDL